MHPAPCVEVCTAIWCIVKDVKKLREGSAPLYQLFEGPPCLLGHDVQLCIHRQYIATYRLTGSLWDTVRCACRSAAHCDGLIAEL